MEIRFKMTGKEPWCGVKITILQDIIVAARSGKSLIGNVVWARNRPIPAAFVQNMIGVQIYGAIKKGLWIYILGNPTKRKP